MDRSHESYLKKAPHSFTHSFFHSFFHNTGTSRAARADHRRHHRRAAEVRPLQAAESDAGRVLNEMHVWQITQTTH